MSGTKFSNTKTLIYGLFQIILSYRIIDISIDKDVLMDTYSDYSLTYIKI